MDCSNRGDAILLFAIKPFKTEDLSLKGGQKRKKKKPLLSVECTCKTWDYSEAL